MKAFKKFQTPVFTALLVLTMNSGCDESAEQAELSEDFSDRPELDAEEHDEDDDVPELVDVFLMPEGSVIHSVYRDTEEDAIADFAEVLAFNGVSGEFRVDPLDDGSWDLVLLHAEPGEGDISEEIYAGDDDGLTPRKTYYHDYYTTSRNGPYGTSVFARDDQGLGWALASGKTSHMVGSAHWNSYASLVYFAVTEVWNGTSLSGSIPWGLSGSIGGSKGSYTISTSSPYGNSAYVEWCVTGPFGWAFSSKTLTASLAVKAYGSTFMVTSSSKSYFVPDWSSSSDAC